MTFLEKLNTIKRLDELIRRRATGTPNEIAIQLGISRRTFFSLIKLMRGMNAPIEYCNTKNTYYYRFNGEFIAVVFRRSNKEATKTKAKKENPHQLLSFGAD